MGARDDQEWLRIDRRIGGRMPHLGASRSFAILRCAKIKTLGNMGASLQHTFRERDTPNADTRRTPDNTILVGGETASTLDTNHAAERDRAVIIPMILAVVLVILLLLLLLSVFVS